MHIAKTGFSSCIFIFPGECHSELVEEWPEAKRRTMSDPARVSAAGESNGAPCRVPFGSSAFGGIAQDRLLTLHELTEFSLCFIRRQWCPLQGSNLQPSVPKTDALSS